VKINIEIISIFKTKQYLVGLGHSLVVHIPAVFVLGDIVESAEVEMEKSDIACADIADFDLEVEYYCVEDMLDNFPLALECQCRVLIWIKTPITTVFPFQNSAFIDFMTYSVAVQTVWRVL
jgi:hypothetical protein